MDNFTHPHREFELAALAKRQHGVLSRRQLLSLGLGRGAIDSRLRSGRIHAIHRGVYAVGHACLSQRGMWLAAVLAHEAGAWLAAVPAHEAGAVLSHASAAALWRLI